MHLLKYFWEKRQSIIDFTQNIHLWKTIKFIYFISKDILCNMFIGFNISLISCSFASPLLVQHHKSSLSRVQLHICYVIWIKLTLALIATMQQNQHLLNCLWSFNHCLNAAKRNSSLLETISWSGFCWNRDS